MANVDAARQLTGAACPTIRLCLVTDGSGNVTSSRAPSARASAWRTVTIDRGHHLNAISCPSLHLCVAIDRAGGVLSTADPAGPASAWRRAKLPRADRNLQAISCPSTRLCVASDADADVIVSNHPRDGARAWHRLQAIRLSPPDPFAFLETVACSSPRLCVGGGIALGTEVFGFTSQAPARPTPWRGADVNGYPHENTPRLASGCRTDGICVLTMDNGDGSPLVLVQHGTRGWKRDDFPGEQNRRSSLEAVGCAPRGLCVIGDSAGNVIVGR